LILVALKIHLEQVYSITEEVSNYLALFIIYYRPTSRWEFMVTKLQVISIKRLKMQRCKPIERRLRSQFHLLVLIPLCLVLIELLHFFIQSPISFTKTINLLGHLWLIFFFPNEHFVWSCKDFKFKRNIKIQKVEWLED
jgi:hypothetical protein